MGQRRRSSEVRSRGKEADTKKVQQIDKGVWKETIRKDADKEDVGSYNRC